MRNAFSNQWPWRRPGTPCLRTYSAPKNRGWHGHLQNLLQTNEHGEVWTDESSLEIHWWGQQVTCWPAKISAVCQDLGRKVELNTHFQVIRCGSKESKYQWLDLVRSCSVRLLDVMSHHFWKATIKEENTWLVSLSVVNEPNINPLSMQWTKSSRYHNCSLHPVPTTRTHQKSSD